MDAADIIKIENSEDNLARYEELLLRRDNLHKKAEQYQIIYFREFGDLIVESYTIRVECINKEKDHCILPTADQSRQTNQWCAARSLYREGDGRIPGQS